MNKPNPTIRQATFAARRARFIESMGRGIAVIPTAPETVRNRDSHFPYRNDSYFHYLSGFTEPEAVLVLIAGESPKSILFCREKNAEREVWDGFRFGPEAARKLSHGRNRDHRHARGSPAQANGQSAHDVLRPGADPAWDRASWAASTGCARNPHRRQRPGGIHDVRAISRPHALAEGRGRDRPDAARRGHLRGAHTRAMARTRPGWFEYQVEAELPHEFLRHGALSPPIFHRRRRSRCLRAALPGQ